MVVRLKASGFCAALLGVVIVATSSAENTGAVHFIPSSGEIPRVAGPGSLTISGKNYWHRQFYSGGDYPQVSAYDTEGSLLPDGSYSYEFRSITGSSKPGGQLGSVIHTHSSPSVVSGAFEIQGGALLLR